MFMFNLLRYSYFFIIPNIIGVTLKLIVIQATLDGSNSDLSKFSIRRSKTAVPFFFSIKQSKFTPDLSNSRSLEVLNLSN